MRLPRLWAVGVDVGSAVNLVGTVLKYLGVAFLLPAAIAVAESEPVWPFVASGLITGGSGFVLERGTRGKELIGPREGFLVVALIWLALPVFGALPYLFADEPQLARPIDAYFEAMSGFTATGATVLTDIEAVDSSLLMWRQFTQWLGGMGIIVLAVAILPRLRVGGRQLLQSELAGPDEIERLSATIRETARRLWVLYVVLTLAAIALFALYGWTGVDPEMNLYQAAAHAFSTLSIGGFSTQNNSVAAFAAATQWTIASSSCSPASTSCGSTASLVRGQFRRGDPRRRVSALPRVPARPARSCSCSSFSAGTSSGARRPSAMRSSRRSRS